MVRSGVRPTAGTLRPDENDTLLLPVASTGTNCATLPAVNLLLVEPAEIDPLGRVRVQERRAEHLRGVLRVHVGDELRIGVIGGPTGTATVTQVADDRVDLEVRLSGLSPPPPDVEPRFSGGRLQRTGRSLPADGRLHDADDQPRQDDLS